MKCPHCKKDIEIVESPRVVSTAMGWFLPNLIVAMVGVGIILQWIIPWDIEQGYAANYDMVILLGLTIVYSIYLWLYGKDKVKGRFVLMTKGLK